MLSENLVDREMFFFQHSFPMGHALRSPKNKINLANGINYSFIRVVSMFVNVWLYPPLAKPHPPTPA